MLMYCTVYIVVIRTSVAVNHKLQKLIHGLFNLAVQMNFVCAVFPYYIVEQVLHY